jgi:hypothetical protein
VRYQSEVFIAGPPDVVWGELVDLRHAPEYVPLVTAVDPDAGLPLRSGSRLHLTVDYLSHRLDIFPVAEVFEPESRLMLREERPSLGVVELEWSLASQSGGTRLTMMASIAFHSLLTQLAARSLVSDQVIQDEVDASLARFKARVEERMDRQGGRG